MSAPRSKGGENCDPKLAQLLLLSGQFEIQRWRSQKQDKSVENPQSDGRSQSFLPSYRRSGSRSGLSVIPEFISPRIDEDLLQFLENQQWRTDLARRTMHFGGTYCLMPSGTQEAGEPKPKPEIITAPPIPPEFHDLMERFFEDGIYDRRAPPEYCIVNEYKATHGISAHVENFTFGEPVCSLTLHDGDHMRFHELETAHDGSVRSGKSRLAKRTGRKVDVWLPPRSLAVLRGDARYKWQHEIVRSRTGRSPCRPGEEWKRTSLTFRVKR